MANRMFSFVGGTGGRWQVTRLSPVIGAMLDPVTHVDVLDTHAMAHVSGAAWVLRGVTSHERYVNRDEKSALVTRQPTLERPQATCAALIPVKKTAEWWALPQDERRAVFETRSRHIYTGMEYLPAVARRLHHCYDLGEPFDFLTWFEYAPEDSDAFEELTNRLRETEEWRYVDREVDIRLMRV